MHTTLCPFCMRETHGEVCPHCKKSVAYSGEPLHLQVGYVLNGSHPYVLGASLGQGGFGITYIALDLSTSQRVAIKEYYPSYCAGRNGNVTVAPYRGQEEVFLKGKNQFLKEAQMLTSLSDLGSVVNVHDYFEANNTAYLVMEFLEGSSLKDHVEKNGKLPAQQFLNQMKPLMADMDKMHQRGVVHRDIAPDNIIALPDGQLKLIDFGAARSYLGDNSMTVVVKKGFAPVEQYMRKGSNASADIYALAATIYYCITGIVPPDSAERQYGQVMQAPTELGIDLTAEQELALEKALAVQPRERTQRIADVIAGFDGIAAPVTTVTEAASASQPERKSSAFQRNIPGAADSHREKASVQADPGKIRPAAATATGTAKSGTAPKKSGKNFKALLLGVAVLALVLAAAILLPFSRKSAPAQPSEPKLSNEPVKTDIPSRPAETLPADILPDEPAPTEPVPDPVLVGNVYKELSYNYNTGGSMTHLFGENLTIMVKNYNDITVTLSGLNMKDEYILENTKDHANYSWSVSMKASGKNFVLSAALPTPKGNERNLRFANATGRLSSLSANGKVSKLENAQIYYTEDSISWQYTMDDKSFLDLRAITGITANVQDPSQDLNLEYVYTRDSGLQLSDLDPTAPALVIDPDSDVQQLIGAELTAQMQWLTPIPVREGGSTPQAVYFLDKPVNNCLSLTAEVTVDEGNADEFIVYIQDLERWREVGRIASNGDPVVTGTITFDEMTSFNAYAIAPANSTDASISYRLTTAQIYGNGLPSQWTNNHNATFNGPNLSVSASANRTIRVTLSGLSLMDTFPSVLDAPKGTEEYRWSVSITSGNYSMTFQTLCAVPVQKYNQPMATTWKEMNHTFTMTYLEFGEDVDHVVKKAKPTVTHTADSITWTYTMDKNQPFDFATGIIAEIDWVDHANNRSGNAVYFGR